MTRVVVIWACLSSLSCGGAGAPTPERAVPAQAAPAHEAATGACPEARRPESPRPCAITEVRGDERITWRLAWDEAGRVVSISEGDESVEGSESGETVYGATCGHHQVYAPPVAEPGEIGNPLGSLFGIASPTYEQRIECDEHGHVTAEIRYDPVTRIESERRFEYEHDRRGNWTSMWEAGRREAAHLERTYDDRCRPLTERTTIGGESNEVAFEWDGSDHLVRESDSRGKITTRTYDDAGRLVAVLEDSAGLDTAHAFRYDENGRLVRYEIDRRADGDVDVVTEHSYDAEGRLVHTTRVTTERGGSYELLAQYRCEHP